MAEPKQRTADAVVDLAREGLAATPSFLAEIVAAIFLVLATTRIFYWRASQVGQRVHLTAQSFSEHGDPRVDRFAWQSSAPRCGGSPRSAGSRRSIG